MADVIEVAPDDTLDTLLGRLGAGMQPVVLWVPRGNTLMRRMESYQALKEATRKSRASLRVLSPDARVVGMAMVFGLEAETAAQPPGTGAAPSASPAPEPTTAVDMPPRGRDAGDESPTIAAAPPAPQPAPSAPSAGSQPGAAAGDGSVSESDWLFSGDLDLSGVLLGDDQAGARSSTPPADVRLTDGFALLGSVPAAPAAAAGGPSDVTVPLAASAMAPLPDPIAVTPPAPHATPAADAAGDQPLATPAAGEDPERPMTFAEWLALQKRQAAASAAPVDVDLTKLPGWLQPGGSAAPAPSSATSTGSTADPRPLTGAPATLRCPHCGKELDKNEMLALLAQMWGG
ncbi:MAG TPA: hypothetical protein VM536_03615 [Chloroflexia bacterium]|nr:hypothetical protein [Chloroflexia bacterium]